MDSYESTFKSQIISEWESQYINYPTLNKLRKRLKNEYDVFKQQAKEAKATKKREILKKIEQTKFATQANNTGINRHPSYRKRNISINDFSNVDFSNVDFSNAEAESTPIELSKARKYNTFSNFQQLEENLPACQDFVVYFINETQRIEDFYKKTLEGKLKRLEILENQTQRYLDDITSIHSIQSNRQGLNRETSIKFSNSEEELDSFLSWDDHVDHRQESIQNAFVDIYRRMHFLQSYVEINCAALQRFVQEIPYPRTRADLREKLYEKEFSSKGTQECEKFCKTLELSFAKFIGKSSSSKKPNGHGYRIDSTAENLLDLKEAKALLLAKQSPTMKFTDVIFGFRLGVAFTLFTFLIWESIMQPTMGRINIIETDGFSAIRAACCFVVAYWGWTITFLVWVRYRINFVLLFRLNPELVRPYSDMVDDATNMSMVVASCSLLYYKTTTKTMPLVFPPIFYLSICWIYLLVKFIFPTRVVTHNILAPLTLAMLSPFSEVTLYSTYVADWMTSLVRVEVDVAYGICYFFTADYLTITDELPDASSCKESILLKYYITPIICILPLYFRFMQCVRLVYDANQYWPNLGNCIKYGLAQLTLLLGIFHPPNSSNLYNGLWLVLFSCSSLYAWYWDVVFNWGLGDIRYGFLSSRQMYPKKSVYYIAIFMDLILRHSWLLNFIPPEPRGFFFKIFPEFVLWLATPTLIVISELIRRTFWSLFALENEHLKNTKEFQNHEVIPLHFEGVCNDGLQKKSNNGIGKAVELFLFVFLSGYIVYKCIAW